MEVDAVRMGLIGLALAVIGCGAPGDALVGEWFGVAECAVTVEGSGSHNEPAYDTTVLVRRDVAGELVGELVIGGDPPSACSVGLDVVTEHFLEVRPGSSSCDGAVPWVVTSGTLGLSPVTGRLDVGFGASYLTGPSSDVLVSALCSIDGAER